MGKFYYVTAGSGRLFLNNYTKYSIKSLIKAGVGVSDIHLAVNNKDDKKCIKRMLPELENIYLINEDLSKVVWKYSKGKRKYSLFKIASLYKAFPKPVENKYMIYFDGDVLWYKNPAEFFETKCSKTWFHHGKDLESRSKYSKSQIDVTDVNSLKEWCSEPQAHLMVKYGCKKIPDREAVAGLYLLHPRDHEKVLKLTYECCVHNSTRFGSHEGGGDQKPMNAAINILDIDWSGGSRFFCPEHKDYFDHYFGKDNEKEKFRKKIVELEL